MNCQKKICFSPPGNVLYVSGSRMWNLHLIWNLQKNLPSSKKLFLNFGPIFLYIAALDASKWNQKLTIFMHAAERTYSEKIQTFSSLWETPLCLMIRLKVGIAKSKIFFVIKITCKYLWEFKHRSEKNYNFLVNIPIIGWKKTSKTKTILLLPS